MPAQDVPAATTDTKDITIRLSMPTIFTNEEWAYIGRATGFGALAATGVGVLITVGIGLVHVGEAMFGVPGLIGAIAINSGAVIGAVTGFLKVMKRRDDHDKETGRNSRGYGR